MKKSKVQKDNKSKSPKKSRGAVYHYICNALLYVLISLFVFAPLMLIGLDKAKNTVIDAQSYLTIGYNDLRVDETPNDKTGKDFINSIKNGSLLGTVTCDRIGLNEKVYYGYNRVTARNGVGLSDKSYLFGMGGTSKIVGYASSSFKTLYNVEKGDIIAVDSNLGTYEYKVYKYSVSEEEEETDGDVLVLTTSKSSNAFASFSNEKFYVYARLTGEVQ